MTGSERGQPGRAASAEPAGLAGYDPRRYPPVAVTADLVVLTVRDDDLAVLRGPPGRAAVRGRARAAGRLRPP